jgi:hypothetical protein
MIGYGSLSVFDDPARAIGCASEFAEAATALELDVRAGLHCGECEMLDEEVAGIAGRFRVPPDGPSGQPDSAAVCGGWAASASRRAVTTRSPAVALAG